MNNKTPALKSSSMKVAEVITPQDIIDFIKVPLNIYRGNPHWIRPLDMDVESVFDKKKNKTFRHGECCRWLLRDSSGNAIGRVAAFVNKKTVHKGNKQPTGGMGFFESPNDQEAAFLLFDQCREWLAARGMEAMDGTINFGNRDRWWGLLVEGFDKEPNYQCNYNPPYYKDLFEAYGFQVYFKQFTFARKVRAPLSEKLKDKANRIMKDSNYSVRYINKSDLRKLAEYIRIVYNQAWAKHAGEDALSQQQVNLIVKQMKPILDPKLVFFGFYKGDPVSFFISIPEVNQIFKYVNGRLDWWGKLLFLWHSWRKTNRKALGVLFGIAPQHQGKGLDGAMIMTSGEVLQERYRRYEEYEMNWIGDFNPRMITVVQQVGAHIQKTHHTYRKLFDESKPFERCPTSH